MLTFKKIRREITVLTVRMDARAAAVAVDTIICFVNGFTIEEQSRRPADPTRRTRADRDADFRAGLGQDGSQETTPASSA